MERLDPKIIESITPPIIDRVTPVSFPTQQDKADLEEQLLDQIEVI